MEERFIKTGIIKRIAITGPESTGKSRLAKELAQHYSTAFVPEFARDYVACLNRPYNSDDILHIAQKQIESENEISEFANKLLICDTDLLVTKVWCEHAFNFCHEWILKNIQSHQYDLYLLCNIDLNWEFDPLREHPHLREHFFNLYKSELIKTHFPFAVISGNGEIRLQNAIHEIDKII